MSNEKKSPEGTPYHFLFEMIEKKKPVNIKFNDGTDIECIILGFDNYTIMCKQNDGVRKLIFKHNIFHIAT